MDRHRPGGAADDWASARALRTGESVIGQLLEIERFDGGRTIVLNSAAPILDEQRAAAGAPSRSKMSAG